MSLPFAPPLSPHALSICLKRSLPSGGFQDVDDTLPRKRLRDQNQGLLRGVASPSSASLTQVPSASFQGPKSLQHIRAERSTKTSTSSASNLACRDRSPSMGIGRTTICLSRPSVAATTVWKGPISAKDSKRDFEGPKSLAEILKEKRQRSAVQQLSRTKASSEPWASKGHGHHVDELKQKPDAAGAHTHPEELEEGEFRPSNRKDDSSPSYSTSTLSSATVSPSHDSNVGSSMAPAEDDAESQQLAAAASRCNEAATLGTVQLLEDDASDDAEFDDDIDIDDAHLELYFNESDYISCKLGTEQLLEDDDIDDAEFDDDIDIDDAHLELYFNESDYISCKQYVTSFQ